MSKRKVILVTGASGFVGRQCLKPLVERGYEVHAVARRPLFSKEHVVWHMANLLQEEEQKQLLQTVRPHVLLHAAWYAEHGKFWHAPENYHWLTASMHLFTQAARLGVKRIIGIGSCAEYDWHRSDATPWKEIDPAHPHTLYGQSKLALLRHVEGLDINYAWARLFLLFGRHEAPSRLVPSIIQSLLQDEPAYCTSGSQIRDFMQVSEAGVALASLADSNVQDIINIASGQPVTIADIAHMLGAIVQKPKLIRLNALPERADDPAYMVADITRLRNELAFTPTASLEQHLAETVEWWKQSHTFSPIASNR